jgi:hypothetical protein
MLKILLTLKTIFKETNNFLIFAEPRYIKAYKTSTDLLGEIIIEGAGFPQYAPWFIITEKENNTFEHSPNLRTI